MITLPETIRLGTRGSPLAMLQAHEARDRLVSAHPGLTVEIVEVAVTGDQVQDRPLSAIGGKGLFTKELDRAILDGRCDAAVHSMKDVETWLPDGIGIVAILPREDVRDAFISARADSLDALPAGATLGTSSLRRKAQILVRRPDLDVVLFRGSVQTRLKKLADGVADATLLAMAGLNRLGMAHAASEPLAPDVMLPAVAQGAIGVTAPTGRDDIAALFHPLDDVGSASAVHAERAFLEVLDGSCHTPIAGLCQFSGDRLRFRGLVAREDGTRLLTVEREGPAVDAMALARDAAHELRAAMGDDFFG